MYGVDSRATSLLIFLIILKFGVRCITGNRWRRRTYICISSCSCAETYARKMGGRHGADESLWMLCFCFLELPMYTGSQPPRGEQFISFVLCFCAEYGTRECFECFAVSTYLKYSSIGVIFFAGGRYQSKRNEGRGCIHSQQTATILSFLSCFARWGEDEVRFRHHTVQ